MDKTIEINVAECFSKFIRFRNKIDGEFSGEEFQDEILIPSIKKAIDFRETIIIDLNGIISYSCDFFYGAFDGIKEKCKIESSDICKIIKIKCDNVPHLVKQLENYVYESA